MESKKKHIVIIAGEASGDLHASHLVDSLKALDPSLTFSGLGGQKMLASGVDIVYDMTRIAVVGFWEVLKHYPKIKKVFNDSLSKIKKDPPDAVVLVDYPGFNLRLAKELKDLPTKVIYFISPQIWAWKENRINFIKEHVDEMLVLFPFEEKFYAERGVKVKYVGHPLLDSISVTKNQTEFLTDNELSDYKTTIGLLPRSRKKEVEKILPVMLKTSAILKSHFPMMQFMVVKADTIEKSFIDSMMPDDFPDMRIIDGSAYDAINASDICMVASGTATLETAILQKPMVVIYKTSLLTWLLAKMFVKIRNIGLVNIVAGKRIVPECIQYRATAKNIASTVKDIFTNEDRISEIRDELKEVKNSLGKHGAIDRAAEEVLSILQ